MLSRLQWVFVIIGAMMLSTSVTANSAIADFSVHPSGTPGPWGVYNYSNSAGGVPTWTDQYEDTDWIISVWMDFAGAAVNYRYRIFDKINSTATVGTVGGALTGVFGIPALPTANQITSPYLNALRNFAPNIAMLEAPPTGGERAVAIAILQNGPAPGDEQLEVHFLEFTPAGATTPATWAFGNREEIVVDNNAICPSVCALEDGGMAVAWADGSPAGTIGDQPGINPSTDPNASFINGTDVYLRRYQPNVQPNPAPGAIDNATPSSTVNVAQSLGGATWPEAVSDGQNAVFVSWIELGSQADGVAGLPSGDGPQGGAFGGNQERADVFIRKVTATAAGTALQLGQATNVSFSRPGDPSVIMGTTFGGPPDLEFNRQVRQVSVTFVDDTIDYPLSSTIAQEPGLYATAAGSATVPAAAFDLFQAFYNENLTKLSIVPVTRSKSNEIVASVGSNGVNGWVTAYATQVAGTNPNVIDIRAEHQGFTVNGQSAGSTSVYPSQISAPGNSTFSTIPMKVSAVPNGSVSVVFSHRVNNGPGVGVQPGNPQDLRPGQNQSAAGFADLFMAHGEAFPNAGGASFVQYPRASAYVYIPNAQENSDEEALNERIRNNPVYHAEDFESALGTPRVRVTFDVRNGSGTDPLNLDTISVTPPFGFVNVSGDPLPNSITIPPNLSQFFSVEYEIGVGNSAPNPGRNAFAVSASGTIAGFPNTGTVDVPLMVTGETGNLLGVNVSVQINPTSYVTGRSRQYSMIVSVQNGGGETLRDIELSGPLLPGILPTAIEFANFDPPLDTTEIVSGGVRSFTANLTFGGAIDGNDPFVARKYTPAVAAQITQAGATGGGRQGTITSAPEVPLSIDPPQPEELQPPIPVLNDDGSGCSLFAQSQRLGGASMLLLLLVGFAFFVYRRRKMA